MTSYILKLLVLAACLGPVACVSPPLEGTELTENTNRRRFCPDFAKVSSNAQPGELIFSCLPAPGVTFTLAEPSRFFEVKGAGVFLNASLDSMKGQNMSIALNITDVDGAIWQRKLTIMIHDKSPSPQFPRIFLTGTNVTLTCIAKNYKSKPYFLWSYFDNIRRLRNSTRTSWETIPRNGFWMSELKFSPILFEDTGGVKCEVTGEGFESGVEPFPFIVAAYPTIVAVPQISYIRPGTNQTLACRVTGNGTEVWFREKGRLTWYQLIGGGRRRFLKQSQGGKLQLNLTVQNVTGDTSYFCEGTLPRGTMMQSAVAKVIYVSDGNIKRCRAVVGADGVVWKEVPAGSTVQSTCPTPLGGTSSRRCNSDGIWLEPDYDSECYSSQIFEILGNATNEMGSTEPGGKFLTDVNEAMQTTSMTSKDVDIVLEILESIANGYTQDENKPVTSKDLKKFVTIADNMMAVSPETWNRAAAKKKRGPKSMLWSVDTVARQAVERLSKQGAPDKDYNVTVSTKTIFLQIGVVEGTNVNFPLKQRDNPPWLNDQMVYAFMPKETFAKAPNGTVWFSGIIYRTMASLMEKQDFGNVEMTYMPAAMAKDMEKMSAAKNVSTGDVVSRVLAFTVYPKNLILDPPLHLTMQVSRTNADPMCSFIEYSNASTGSWATDGCKLVSRDGDMMTCACSHTTNFAILMSPAGPPEERHNNILSFISITGCAISMFFLLLTIVIYCMVWKYMIKSRVAKVKSVLLMHLCCTLIISYSLLLGGAQLTANRDVCTAIAALLHYFFLVVFFVMLAEGVHLFISIVVVINFVSYLKALVIMIWVTPALIVGITLGILKVDGYTQQRYCWLSTERSVIWAFIGPALVIIVVNTCILAAALREMMKRKNWEDNLVKQGRYLARGLGILIPIVGIAWLFGVFAINRDLVVFQYIFAICNSLQGLFIFVFHCLTSNVRSAFKERRNKFNRQSISKSTTRTDSSVRRKSSGHSMVSTTKSNNSNFTLRLSTNSMRVDSLGGKGSSLSRLIALPSVFYLDADTQTQTLIKEDNFGDRGSISPSSGKHVNFDFSDARKHVSFPPYHIQDVNIQDEISYPFGEEFVRNRRSPNILPKEEEQETEVERQMRLRRKRIDQMYAVCNAFTELKKNQNGGAFTNPWYHDDNIETKPSSVRDKWKRAVESVTTRKTSLFSRQLSRDSTNSKSVSRQVSYEDRNGVRPHQQRLYSSPSRQTSYDSGDRI